MSLTALHRSDSQAMSAIVKPVPHYRPETRVPFRPHPQPLKQLRYHAPVTVCLAGLCRDRDGRTPLFVLCSDRKLDEGELGASDMATKVFPLGYNWAAQMAGHWTTAIELARIIRAKNLDVGPPGDRLKMFELIEGVTAGFVASPICNKDFETSLTVTGFIDGEPLILSVWIHTGGTHEVCIHQEIACTGEGGFAASLLLKHRSYNPRMGVEEACFCLYEAKRFSEIVGSVGPRTVISVHGAGTPEKGTVYAKYLGETALQALEKIRLDVSIKPLPPIQPFPSEFYL